MKFGFIARRKQKSFECLMSRAAERGHEVVHIPLQNISLSEDGVKTFAESCTSEYDAIHYYAGVADPIGVAFGMVFDDMGVPMLNNRAHIPHLVHDKMFQTLSFVRAGLPVPKTEFSIEADWDDLKSKLGSPFVAKRVRGTQGKHVHIINEKTDLSVVEGPSNYLFQEYLPHSNDIRVLVLDRKAVCAYKRVPLEGDFRANLALGGKAEALESEAEKSKVFSLAEAAVSAVPHDLAGVDIIKSDKDNIYRLIEINTNPSWYGIYASTNINFSDALLDKYEMMANSRK